ncbi:MAG TPA: hypothetical protein ENN21_10385 [Spirochaetes bacterium]|nr:hypothetical protein [Spirochaetota bacterium]
MPDDKKVKDTDLDFFDIDVDLENPFAEETREQKPRSSTPSRKGPAEPDTPVRETLAEPKRRSSKDFNPDMDMLLLTAQSPMIIEGMKSYTRGDFSSSTLSIYTEALKGVSLYIKILDRNPKNYYKLKALIDSDTDCKEVEEIAFNLYKKLHNTAPEADHEKLSAFEKFESLFRDAANKASISNSMKSLKKYMLMSGSIDEIKVKDRFNCGAPELASDIKNFEQHIKLAHDLLQKGKGEIAKGLKGRDLNIYIIKTSYLLYYYYTISGNDEKADYFGRIHNNYKKYFIIRD